MGQKYLWDSSIRRLADQFRAVHALSGSSSAINQIIQANKMVDALSAGSHFIEQMRVAEKMTAALGESARVAEKLQVAEKMTAALGEGAHVAEKLRVAEKMTAALGESARVAEKLQVADKTAAAFRASARIVDQVLEAEKKTKALGMSARTVGQGVACHWTADVARVAKWTNFDAMSSAARAVGKMNDARWWSDECRAGFNSKHQMAEVDRDRFKRIGVHFETIAKWKGKFNDRSPRSVPLPDFDVSGILDPSSSDRQVARGVESLVEAIDSVVRDCAELDEAHASEHDEQTSQQDVGAELLVGRRRLWSPGEAASIWIPRNRDEESQAAEPVTMFCGHSLVDRHYLDALIRHLCVLRAKKIIRPWHEGEISGGEDRTARIWEHIELAKLIVLLVSSDYLSELLDSGMMDRIERQRRRARVVPVLVRSVDFEGTFIERLSPLPSCGNPVENWQRQEQAWCNVARGIRSVVESIRGAGVRATRNGRH